MGKQPLYHESISCYVYQDLSPTVGKSVVDCRISSVGRWTGTLPPFATQPYVLRPTIYKVGGVCVEVSSIEQVR